MKSLASAFVAGLIFSIGLVLGGMTIPNNIIGFLDLTGTWKPSLIFVMAGAIFVFAVAFRLVLRRQKPVFVSEFDVPTPGPVTLKLFCGATLFGIGWGLAGFCPGPALVALGAGSAEALIFVPCMLVGMSLYYFRSLLHL